VMSKETTALMDPETQSYRLPRIVVPEKYEITLEPDLVNFTFAGEETIHVIVSDSTDHILMNALELEIQEATISNSRNEEFKADITLDTENERVKLSFGKSLGSGSWKLHLKFTGILNDKLHGFYRSTYKDAEGQTKVIATTQFEATDARRAFPCWDEPDFKAVYKVTLIVDETLTAISNAKIKKEIMIPERAKKQVLFHDTMKMSTYLVAFIVGEFEATPVIDADGTPVRVWAPPGKLHLAKFAEGIAQHSLTFFNSYYGLKYPGDKLELIAIPDFAFGAMENLGAVTFRETALLVDEKTASHAELERVADVVAHEIAHMWFGDLATMKWWNGIWLNEAFATFMEMLAVDSWKPEWKRWESFGVSRAQAFATDGLKSTRTIEFPVRRPEEAQGMFDILTYEKGASVLRMLEQFLGPEVFRRGISFYLAKHKYSNTETNDLWDAIEESSKQPVRDMMDSWIFQEGHPLVSVELDKSGKALTFKQQRFMYASADDSGKGKDTLFHVPIMVKVKSGKSVLSEKFLLTEETHTLNFEDKVQYVVVNEGGHGFYRVRYSPDLLRALTMKREETLNAIERFNLVNDTWAAVLAGLQPLSEYLEMIRSFEDETDKNVWTVIAGSLQYLERVTCGSPALKDFTKSLCSPAFKRLGWELKDGEDNLKRQLRGLLALVLGTTGDDEKVQAEARELYAKYKADKASVGSDVVPALVTILAHTGTVERYQEFENDYKNASSPQEEDRFMYSLTAFQDKELLKQTLEKTLTGSFRTQNAPFVVRMVLQNSAARDVAWPFVKENWQRIIKTFPEVSLPRMSEGVTGLVSDELLKETRQFFKDNPIRQGKKLIEQNLEKQSVAVALKNREAKTLKTF
jgi:puromycin-sensitive aminopeptidase